MAATAYLALREGLPYRRDAFESGLKRLGYRVVHDITMRPAPGDVLVIWNRYGQNDTAAKVFEKRDLPIVVAENGYLGNDFIGDRWYALSADNHNGAGWTPNYGGDRWESFGVELAPMRTGQGSVLLLPQRGIGCPGVAMPLNWLAGVERKCIKKGVQYRVRHHPGGRQNVRPFVDDLEGVTDVLTWGSGAAIKAALHGVRVWSDMPRWIGRSDNTEAGRLAMFHRVAWGMWRLSEIESGEALATIIRGQQ